MLKSCFPHYSQYELEGQSCVLQIPIANPDLCKVQEQHRVNIPDTILQGMQAETLMDSRLIPWPPWMEEGMPRLNTGLEPLEQTNLYVCLYILYIEIDR